MHSEIAHVFGEYTAGIPQNYHPTVVVSGSSMSPAYNDGDRLLTQVAGEYQRGDVVVMEYTDQNLQRRITLKRIIGLPGDTVKISEGRVFINGEVLEEQYATGETKITNHTTGGSEEVNDPLGGFGFQTIYEGETRTIVLGENHYYLLGDQRENSLDSRTFGPVHRMFISGKVKKLF
jgi:signal peptidase I